MISRSGSVKLSSPPGGSRFARTKGNIQKVKHRLRRKKRVSARKLSMEHVGCLRSGFEYFVEGFAPPHFPPEITTFQVELDKLYRFHYSVFRPKILNSQKPTKTVKKPFENTSNFVKPVAIRLEMLSNFLIHRPSRIRRALSNGHISVQFNTSGGQKLRNPRPK